MCRIGCGGVPMRVYNRAIGNGSWASVEDYLPAGNALGYNQHWQYRHTGGELLMMTASGEPSAYYPLDSNGLAVQNAPAQPCVCLVFVPAQTAACPPLGYGGCDGQDPCEGLLAFDFYGFCRGKKKTYETCVDFCKTFAEAYCKGAGVGIDPWVGRICNLIAKKGCEALCNETNERFNPFTKCWLICPKVTKPGSSDCVECCNKYCKWKDKEVQKGGLARCLKECAIAPEPEE